MIHKGTHVLVVEGPHASASGTVVAIRREWHAGSATQIKMAEIEKPSGERFKARVSHIRPETVLVEAEEAKRPAETKSSSREVAIEDALHAIGEIVLKGTQPGAGFVFYAHEVRDVLKGLASRKWSDSQ